MRHVLRNLLFGVLFSGAFVFVGGGSPSAFAASGDIHPQVAKGHAFYRYPRHYYHSYDYGQNYRQGYQDGYSDCQQQLPYNPSYEGWGYSDGYNAGYQFCESKRGQGQIKGYQDGYQDGYSTCEQEHQQSLYAEKASPYNQGYGEGYQKGFQQGYNDCEASYNSGPLYSLKKR